MSVEEQPGAEAPSSATAWASAITRRRSKRSMRSSRASRSAARPPAPCRAASARCWRWAALDGQAEAADARQPNLGLAPLIVREIFRIIGELRRRGVSILLVEQNARAPRCRWPTTPTCRETGQIASAGPARTGGRPRDRGLAGWRQHQAMLSTRISTRPSPRKRTRPWTRCASRDGRTPVAGGDHPRHPAHDRRSRPAARSRPLSVSGRDGYTEAPEKNATTPRKTPSSLGPLRARARTRTSRSTARGRTLTPTPASRCSRRRSGRAGPAGGF